MQTQYRQPYRLASQIGCCSSREVGCSGSREVWSVKRTECLQNSIKMKDKADPALVRIRLRCVTSLHSMDKSSSPLRLLPPYPLPLTRCIQAKSSRVRSIEMTTSVAGVQQHGKPPIGANAERLAIPQPGGPQLCHRLRHQLHSRTPSQILLRC